MEWASRYLQKMARHSGNKQGRLHPRMSGPAVGAVAFSMLCIVFVGISLWHGGAVIVVSLGAAATFAAGCLQVFTQEKGRDD